MTTMNQDIVIGGTQDVDLKALAAVARDGASVALDAESRAGMTKCHAFFSAKVESRVPIYGLNTQFGDQVVLLDEHLDDYETERYQNSLQNRQNSLIRSHNCGMGEMAPIEIVRGAMLLRARCLSRGRRGVFRFLESRRHAGVLSLWLDRCERRPRAACHYRRGRGG
jgi:histidine ammonia-lyase